MMTPLVQGVSLRDNLNDTNMSRKSTQTLSLKVTKISNMENTIIKLRNRIVLLRIPQ